VYVPAARRSTVEERQHDPFECFACCGAAFGDQEGEQLRALALEALPNQAAEIDRLFQEGTHTLELLDSPSAGARYPLVRQALGGDAPAETITSALSHSDTGARLEAVPGALPELGRLLSQALGFQQNPADDWPTLRNRLGTFLLTSELAFDLPGGLPMNLAAVPHADESRRNLVLAICDRLRDTEAGREAYIALARAVERDLRLESVLGGSAPGSTRDTFPLQERIRLHTIVHAAASGDLQQAQAKLSEAEQSVWRRVPERLLLWTVAGRCVEFLTCAAEVEATALKRDVRALVDAYCTADGLWRLDHVQRLFEHAQAQCAQEDEIEPLVPAYRTRYRAVAERAQTLFQEAVKSTGWPPEGIRRQTQTFDLNVAPELTERRKTAYFLVDSLRYEMGRDLADALADLGAVTVEGVASILPTTTPCGMAALMPGADGAYTFVEQKDEAVPAIGGTALPGIKERRELLDTRSEPLPGPSNHEQRGRRAAYCRDPHGRSRLPDSRVCGTLVFAADHSHVLVPEVLPGDVLPVPPGEWLLKKRRSLLGRTQAASPGVLLFPARDVGIVGPPDKIAEFAAASGFKTFSEGAGYFHEGLSLQECLVPVVVVRLQMPQATPAGETVKITYRSDRFTSSVVGLTILLSCGLFESSLTIRLEAFDGTTPKAKLVGQAADCDARNPATGEITLQPGENAVPLVIDADYSGRQVEVRATDPRTGAILDRLTLKNDRMV
jgi:PglZ domain